MKKLTCLVVLLCSVAGFTQEEAKKQGMKPMIILLNDTPRAKVAQINTGTIVDIFIDEPGPASTAIRTVFTNNRVTAVTDDAQKKDGQTITIYFTPAQAKAFQVLKEAGKTIVDPQTTPPKPNAKAGVFPSIRDETKKEGMKPMTILLNDTPAANVDKIKTGTIVDIIIEEPAPASTAIRTIFIGNRVTAVTDDRQKKDGHTITVYFTPAQAKAYEVLKEAGKVMVDPQLLSLKPNEKPGIFPSISGVWQEGPPENQIKLSIVQEGQNFTAECTYQHKEAGKVQWRITGTITTDGKITGRLVHTRPKTFKSQVRTAALSVDGTTISGRAEFDGGEHEFSWTRVKKDEKGKK